MPGLFLGFSIYPNGLFCVRGWGRRFQQNRIPSVLVFHAETIVQYVHRSVYLCL